MKLTDDQKHDFTCALAAALGWTPSRWNHAHECASEPNYSYSVCQDAAEAPKPPGLRRGPRLYLSFDGYKNEGRVKISGEGMQDNQGKAFDTYWITRDDKRHNWGSITVSHGKEPAVVARDVQRRLLPGYLDLHAKAIAWLEGERADLDGNVRLAERCAAALGPRARIDDSKADQHEVTVRRALDVAGDGEIIVRCAYGKANIEIRNVANPDVIVALLGSMARDLG